MKRQYPAISILGWDPIEHGNVLALADVCIADVILLCKMRLIRNPQTGKLQVQPTQHTWKNADGERSYDALVKVLDWRFGKLIEKAILDKYAERMRDREEVNASFANVVNGMYEGVGGAK